MVKRQKNHHTTLAGVDSDILGNALDVGHQVLVAEHNTLRTARSTRRIDDKGHLLIVWHIQFSPWQAVGQLTGRLRLALHLLFYDIVWNIQTRLRQRLLYNRDVMLRGPDSMRRTVAQDIGEIRDCTAGIHRNCHSTLLPDAEECINPPLTVFAEYNYPLVVTRRHLLSKNIDVLQGSGK